MASGLARRANRPNTWLHRPSLRREVFPCQLGAVHTWHFASFHCGAEFRTRSEQSGHAARRLLANFENSNEKPTTDIRSRVLGGLNLWGFSGGGPRLASALNYAELAKLFFASAPGGYHDLYRSGERQPRRAFASKTSKFKTKSPSTKNVANPSVDRCFRGAELCVPAMPFTAFVADKLEPLSKTRS
jgi:hypothetical protein